jgi:hypothetical protein
MSLPLTVTTKPFRLHADCSVGLCTSATTLTDFFRKDRLAYLDQVRFPLIPTSSPGICEGGCQFAFNRIATEPMRCLSCHRLEVGCQCLRPRICLQAMSSIDLVILDIERHAEPNKYSPLTESEDLLIAAFEREIEQVPLMAFYYRTKCFGLRVGIRTIEPLTDPAKYRNSVRTAVATLAPLAPGGSFDRANLLYIDHECENSDIFHTYPRPGSNVWINSTEA